MVYVLLLYLHDKSRHPDRWEILQIPHELENKSNWEPLRTTSEYSTMARYICKILGTVNDLDIGRLYTSQWGYTLLNS